MAASKIEITKKQFDEFWEAVLGDEWYIEEWNVEDEEYDKFDDEQLLVIEYMSLGWQGEWGTDPEPNGYLTRGDIKSMSAMPVLRRWLAKQTMTQVSAWIPTEAAPEFAAFLERVGGHK